MQRIATATRAVDLFGAGKHGFKAGNLATGVAPTDLSADFFNNVQEELLAVIEAAGLVPSVATLNQVLTAMRSPGVFQNPDQFDESTRAATTAWVSGAGLKFGFVLNVSSDSFLTKATSGKMVVVVGNTGPINLTLPDCGDVKTGSTIRIQNVSTYPVTVYRQNANTLNTAGTTRNTVVVLPGDYLEVTALATHVTAQWMVGGSTALKYSSSFASTLSPAGIAKRPDGLIEQWGAILTSTGGTAVLTFPTAFPVAQIDNVVSLHSTQVNSPYIVGSDSGSAGQMTVFACNSSGTGAQVYVHWRAWGY